MDDIDRAALLDHFNHRLDSEDAALRAYLAGRIDGHCLQNAINMGELRDLAEREGFRIDWPCALEVVEGRCPHPDCSRSYHTDGFHVFDR